MKALIALAYLGCLATYQPARADVAYSKCIDASDGTNTAWAGCGGEWIKRADKALDDAWTALRSLVADKDTANALRDEQRAWNAYKEQSCLFYASGYYGREGQVLSYPSCRAAVIEARTAELRAYLQALRNP